VYYEATQKAWYVKRFRIETTTVDKKFSFIGDTKGSKALAVSTDKYPRIEISYQVKDRGPVEKMILEPEGFIDVRGWKALGNKLPFARVKEVKMLAPKVVEEAATTPLQTEPTRLVVDDVEEVGNEPETAEVTAVKQLNLFS
jgi:topoisomerase IV subunit A